METLEHRMCLFDMHCHLGFVEDVAAVRCCMSSGDTKALSCTVLPSEYERDVVTFSDVTACTVALGLHPWQVADGVAHGEQLTRFEELAPTTRFIGEVGLDYAGNRGDDDARERQRNVFCQVLDACDATSEHPRKLISLHAVQAANVVLDLLDARDVFSRHQCIFHWFAGTAEELKRAIEAGCFFSVGPRMLATKRGREYARIIPEDRLLLETDSPSHPGEAWDCIRWTEALQDALAVIADMRKICAEELACKIARTSERLLRRA